MESSHPIIEELLLRYQAALGNDFDKYRNHVYRVFFACLLMDADKGNQRKYAIAAVFHDIGIWTDHTFDYLYPSIEQVKAYLSETGNQNWTGEIAAMIYWHHKLSSYKGEHENTVEVFRKADWIDVSLGMLVFNVDKKAVRKIRRQFPNGGFHLFLVKKSLKNLLEHPLNPLPVFKK